MKNIANWNVKDVESELYIDEEQINELIIFRNCTDKQNKSKMKKFLNPLFILHKRWIKLSIE